MTNIHWKDGVHHTNTVVVQLIVVVVVVVAINVDGKMFKEFYTSSSDWRRAPLYRPKE
jgi:hypothetical protein